MLSSDKRKKGRKEGRRRTDGRLGNAGKGEEEAWVGWEWDTEARKGGRRKRARERVASRANWVWATFSSSLALDFVRRKLYKPLRAHPFEASNVLTSERLEVDRSEAESDR